MKSCRIALVLGAAALLAACSPKASIDCTVAQAPQGEFIIRQLNVNSFSVLDTVKADASGRFVYRLEVAKGEPEFVYVFRGETRIAALLLEAGERAIVTADTLGTYTVTGSEGSSMLQEVESASAAFAEEINATDDPAVMSRAYVKYYRERVKYVLSNPYSLTIVPVLFEQLDANSPVFSQYTDAVHFRRASDSLKTVYPDSKYVKALAREATRREQMLNLNYKIANAPQLNYPELVLPDTNGEKVTLSSVDAKVVLLHFWTPSDASHKILNLDVLLPVYKEYHSKGLEIYAVAVDPDKASWAGVVKAQKLPWINVNDGLGTASPALRSYNITSIPASFLLSADGVNATAIDGEKGLRQELAKMLK